jgi:hypothetical protein
MAYTATIQQIQRNNIADTIDIVVRFDGSGPSAGNSIIKTFTYSSSTIPDKPTFKGFIATIVSALVAFDLQVAFLNNQVGKDVSTI